MSLLIRASILLLFAGHAVAQGEIRSPSKNFLLSNITQACGRTKGCFYYPLSCAQNVTNCIYLATWKARINTTAAEEEAEIELWSLNDEDGTRIGWASISTSENEIRDNDDVLACQYEEPGNIQPRDFYNPSLNGGSTRQDDGMVDVKRLVYHDASDYFYCQFTRSLTGTSPSGQDRDLGVPQFLLFARGANFNGTTFTMDDSNILAVSPRKKRVVDFTVVQNQYPDLTLIKVHGSFMIFAFLFLLPVGIILSTFYKIVWPNGGWFFAHIVVMLLTLAFTLAGFITIFEHARNGGQPRFIRTTNIGIAHGVFGIIAFAFLCINPIIGLAKGDPNNKWRKYFFKPIHGSIGLLFVTTIGMTNLILGLNRVAALVSEADFWIIRGSIYFCAGTIGCIIAVMSLFNVYHIIYLKRVLDPNASVQLQEDDITKVKIKDENITKKQKSIVLKPSKDYIPRTVFLGIYILGLLILVGITLGLFNYTPQRTPIEKLPGFVGFV